MRTAVRSLRNARNRIGYKHMAVNPVNILGARTRQEFRQWLAANHASETECWVVIRMGRPTNTEELWYLDAVEEALCFGWIDSVTKNLDGQLHQRFSPRRPTSPWTELNKERVRRLERLGLMTDAGRAVLPAMGPRSFKVDPELEAALKAARAWSAFKQFPPLYQRVRAYNVAFTKKRNPAAYEKALQKFLDYTKRGQMYGEWNDYGRLLED